MVINEENNGRIVLKDLVSLKILQLFLCIIIITSLTLG